MSCRWAPGAGPLQGFGRWAYWSGRRRLTRRGSPHPRQEGRCAPRSLPKGAGTPTQPALCSLLPLLSYMSGSMLWSLSGVFCLDVLVFVFVLAPLGLGGACFFGVRTKTSGRVLVDGHIGPMHDEAAKPSTQLSLCWLSSEVRKQPVWETTTPATMGLGSPFLATTAAAASFRMLVVVLHICIVSFKTCARRQFVEVRREQSTTIHPWPRRHGGGSPASLFWIWGACSATAAAFI